MGYDYRTTSATLQKHLAIVEEKTVLALVEIRRRLGRESEALAECDAAEEELAFLLFCCSLAANWPAVQRFAHNPESVFFAGEATRFGDALWRRLSGLVRAADDNRACKRERRNLGKGLTALRKSLGMAVRCMTDLTNLVPQECRQCRVSRQKLRDRLTDATLATTQYLRGLMEAARMTVELCDALEGNLSELLVAQDAAPWVRFMDVFRGLLAGPEANALEKMSTKNDEFYYEIPRLLLELMGKEAAE